MYTLNQSTKFTIKHITATKFTTRHMTAKGLHALSDKMLVGMECLAMPWYKCGTVDC
jgi:hypothetical protein